MIGYRHRGRKAFEVARRVLDRWTAYGTRDTLIWALERGRPESTTVVSIPAPPATGGSDDTPDFASEVEFWDTNLAPGKRCEWISGVLDPTLRKGQFPRLLMPYVEELSTAHGLLHVLDVGSGPISPLAWGVDQKLLAVTATDPLAKDYARLLKKYQIEYPIKPIVCAGEDLLDLFPPAQFHLVYSRNALDHAVDVGKCIRNASEVLRDDGILYLEGFVREGTRNSWQGLHQHDLVSENGELFHYDRQGIKKSVSGDLGLACVMEQNVGEKVGGWYTLVLRKSLSRRVPRATQ
jgi:SAM-dependent methyltransferase